MQDVNRGGEKLSIFALSVAMGVIAAVQAHSVLSVIPGLLGVASPLMLGSLSLLLTQATRNKSIADCTRRLSQEANSPERDSSASSPDRMNAVIEQLESFGVCFFLNQWALATQYLATLCIVAGVLVSAISTETLLSPAILILDSAVFLFAFGAVMSLFDLFFSQRSFEIERKAALKNARDRRSLVSD